METSFLVDKSLPTLWFFAPSDQKDIIGKTLQPDYSVSVMTAKAACLNKINYIDPIQLLQQRQ